MYRSCLLECIEEKEARLKQLNELKIEMLLIKKQLNELDKQAGKLIDMDPDYSRYIEQCNRDREYLGKLDYEEYCVYLKLLLESPPESELYEKIYGLLKIDPDISKITDCIYDKELWKQIRKALIIKIPDKEFDTWVAKIYPVLFEEGTIRLSVGNEMCKYVIENEYESIILNAIKEVTGNDYRIEYVTNSCI